MFLAVFCAIRGNFPALHAILDAVGSRGIETVFNAGNTVGAYPWPNETIALIRERGVPTVQGVDDRNTARCVRTSGRALEKMPADARRNLEWTCTHTTSVNIEWLGTLPRERRFVIEGISVLLCHGSPTGTRDPLACDTSREVFERHREVANARLILCGGSEAPFARAVEDTLFVCPGAAVTPAGARYAIVDTETTPWSAVFHDAPFDMEHVERRCVETGLAQTGAHRE